MAEHPPTHPARGSLHQGHRPDLVLTRTRPPRPSTFLGRQTQMRKQTREAIFFLDSLPSLNILDDEFLLRVRNKTFKPKNPSVAT